MITFEGAHTSAFFILTSLRAKHLQNQSSISNLKTNFSVYSSSYGMLMPGRNESSSDYRYGFQGQEKDDEVKGEGNSVNYKYRMHDPRVGRFFAVDPLSPEYPHNSPYAFSENSTIAFIELEGLEKFYAVDGAYLGSVGESTELMVVNDVKVWKAYESLKNSSPTKSDNEKAFYSRQESALSNVYDNSSTMYSQDELWNALINWGNENLPKSKMYEQGMMIYSRTFTDESGNEFKGFVLGRTVTDGATHHVQTLNSSLEIGGNTFGGRMATMLGPEKYLETGWNRYAIVHTHPSGGYSSELSPADFGMALELNAKTFMFSGDSKSLYKFESRMYNIETTIDFMKQPLGVYSNSNFDENALENTTFEYKNVVE